jgi:tetratricopeptide (TPR) repeat protein
MRSGDPQGVAQLNSDEVEARKQNDLGNTYARQGQYDQARLHYRQAIKLDPTCAEAHNNLGNTHREFGEVGEAAACFERAVTLKPDFTMAHNNLGIALQELGRFADAEARHRLAIEQQPRYAEAHFNLGNVLSAQLKFGEAIECFKRAVLLNPGYAEAFMNMGNALKSLFRYDEAKVSYQRAYTIRPTYAGAYQNLGNVLYLQESLDDAARCFRRAVEIKPDYAEAYLNLGNIHARQGKPQEALTLFAQALNVQPDYAEAHTNQGLVSLRLGNFAEGWPEYEWRWRLPDLIRDAPAPLWDGGDLDGKTILLYCEQGLGDSIQFVRYAALVKARGARVILSCPEPLMSLFETVAGIDQIIPDGARRPACDFWAPLLSLPLLFGTRIDTIPGGCPYLFVEPDRVAAWAERLRPYSGMKIGVVWAGNSRDTNAMANAVDRRRSIRLEQFGPLFDIAPDAHFFSLQKGAPAVQAKELPQGFDVIDLMDTVNSFADTAALITNLDLVIGVDTSVIHVAGALGKPVWVLSRFDGCWRWMLDRDDSPWYPTLRLFRQPKAGDWASVIKDVSAALGSAI